MKTNELTGPALDWAVAKCEGRDNDCEMHAGNVLYGRVTSGFIQYKPSTDWAQGGPIVEREEIGIKRNAPCSDGRQWEASPSITAKGAGGKFGYGPTPLIAAMRCYVASKLGDEVEIPEELMQ
jgi:hypothetical protein